MNQPALSVVIPCFNEEENIAELYDRLTRVLVATCPSYELVFVDDGSSDHSADVLRKLAGANHRVKVILLSRNFNQHASIAAGFAHATGDRLVLMDADLQDVPEELPKLLAKMDEGYDVVYATRENRDDPVHRRFGAGVFFRLFHSASGLQLPKGVSTYRVVSRRFADAFNGLKEHNRLTAGLMAWLGFSVATVPVRHDARKRGTSHYNFIRLIQLAADGMISFSDGPLKLASKVGIALSLISFTIGIYMIARKLVTGIDMAGYASLIVSVYFLAGIQLFFIGIIGEYLARMYKDVQGRPLYVIKETLNLTAATRQETSSVLKAA